MQSFSISKILLTTILTIFVAYNTVWADEEVPVTEELLQEQFAGKTWECKMD